MSKNTGGVTTIYGKLEDKKKIGFLFGLCFLVYCSTYLGRLNYSASLSEMITTEGFGKGPAGMIGTLFFFSYGAGQLISGFLGDRLPCKWLVLAGLGVSGVLNALMGLLHTPAAMAGVWCVNGMAQAFIWSPLIRILYDFLHTQERLKLCLYMNFSVPVGTILAYVISAVCSATAGWRYAFFLPAAWILAVAAGWWLGMTWLEQSAVSRKVREGKGVTACAKAESEESTSAKVGTESGKLTCEKAESEESTSAKVGTESGKPTCEKAESEESTSAKVGTESGKLTCEKAESEESMSAKVGTESGKPTCEKAESEGLMCESMESGRAESEKDKAGAAGGKADKESVRKGKKLSGSPAGQNSWKRILTASGLCYLICALCVQGALKDGVTTWVPTYLGERHNLGSMASILSTMVIPLCNLFGVTFSSLADRYLGRNEVKTSAVFFGACGLALIVLLWWGDRSAVLALAMLAVSTTSMMAVNTMLIAVMPSRFGRLGKASSVSGVMNSCVYIGGAVSTYGIGALSGAFGWNVTILVWVAGAFLAMGVCFAMSGRWKRYAKEAL